MVNMKIDLKGSGVDVNKASGFAPYEGPLPRPGAYAAILQNCKVRVSQAGNQYFNVLFEFADQTTPEKQQYKGFPLWDKIVPGDSDTQQERVAKFLYTVSGKDPVKTNVAVIHEDLTAGGTVSKIGGKDPVGVRCKVVVNRGSFNGEPQLQLRDLFPWPKDEPWPEGAAEADVDEEEVDEVEGEEEEEPEEDEEEVEVDLEEDTEGSDDEAEEEEEEDDDDAEFQARQEELAGMVWAALKTLVKESNPSFRVLKRHTDDELRDAILDVEFPEDDGPPF